MRSQDYTRSRQRYRSLRLRTGGFSVSAGLPSANMVLWLKADAGTFQDSGLTTPAAANNDPVGGWRSQVGSLDWVQATAGARPLLKTAFLNGQSVVSFDGSDDVLKIAAGTMTAAHVFVLTRVLTGVNSFAGLLTENLDSTDPDFWFSSDITTDNWSTVGSFAAASSRFKVNGTVSVAITKDAFKLYETWDDTPEASDNGLALGQDRNIAVRFWKGEVAEVVAYSAVLSAADAAAVRSYFSSRYGVP